jgi:hypothetical protein
LHLQSLQAEQALPSMSFQRFRTRAAEVFMVSYAAFLMDSGAASLFSWVKGRS